MQGLFPLEGIWVGTICSSGIRLGLSCKIPIQIRGRYRRHGRSEMFETFENIGVDDIRRCNYYYSEYYGIDKDLIFMLFELLVFTGYREVLVVAGFFSHTITYSSNEGNNLGCE